MRQQIPSILFTRNESEKNLTLDVLLTDDSQCREIIHPHENVTVHLGITIAGAVSGGAYIAGAMDYLMQALETWEQLRQRNIHVLRKSRSLEEAYDDKDYNDAVPMYSVIIDVIGGASAGSISAVLTALSLFYEKETKEYTKGSYSADTLLFDAWVNLAEENEGCDSTFAQMLKVDDLLSISRSVKSTRIQNRTDSGDASLNNTKLSNDIPHKFTGIISLLDSKPLHDVKRRILRSWSRVSLEENNTRRKFLPYVSSKLKLALTLTSLRGIPIKFRLSPTAVNGKGGTTGGAKKPWHVMNLHRILAHFQVNPGPEDTDAGTLPLDPCSYQNVETAFDFALASGAFPIGLPPSHVKDLSPKYIEGQVRKLYKIEEDDAPLRAHIKIPDQVTLADNFDLFVVDGGVMNNDPFGEVSDILELRKKTAEQADEDAAKKETERDAQEAAKKAVYKAEDKANDKVVDKAGSEEQFHLTANIFIDPFPNFYDENKTYNRPLNIKHVAMQLIGALIGQSRIKSADLLEKFVKNGRYGMIFPSYTTKILEIQKNPLATGGVEGFAGLISRNLRLFDYQLGKRNCQSFLLNYFSMSKDDIEAINVPQYGTSANTSYEKSKQKFYSFFESWNLNDSSKMKSLFAIQGSKGTAVIKKEGPEGEGCSDEPQCEFRIPIIPIFGVDHETKKLTRAAPQTVDESLWYISLQQLDDLKRPLTLRLVMILKTFLSSFLRPAKKKKDSIFVSVLAFIFVPLCLYALIALIVFASNPLIVIGWICLVMLGILLIIYGLILLVSRYVLNLIKGELRDRKQLAN